MLYLEGILLDDATKYVHVGDMGSFYIGYVIEIGVSSRETVRKRMNIPLFYS